MPKKLTTSQFIERARLVHGDLYSYEKTVYESAHGKVVIVCPTHGEFEQIAANHLNGSGCIHCRNDSFKVKYSFTTDEFIHRAKELFGDKYDYSKTVYTKSHDDVTIVCKRHGEFKKLAYMHLQGQGCPRCNVKPRSSKGQLEIVSYIKSLGVPVSENVALFSNAKQTVDIYCPDHNLAIEFNGAYWHRDDIRDKRFHLNKTIECERQGISLFHVMDYEYWNHPEIVKSMIAHRLGQTTNKIYARDCQIQSISPKESSLFQASNHIQSDASAKVHLGLRYKNELVAVMTFSTPRMNKNYEWELIRYCCKIGTNVIGGAGKLFKEFVRSFSPSSVITYANRRYSQGKLYQALGFSFIKDTEPGYIYTNGVDYGSRMKYQKHKLSSLFPAHYNDSKTEVEIMKSAGYLRVFDCGHKVYEWRS